MYQALSGQLAVVKQMEIIANNLANIGTTGYKTEHAVFETALNQQTALMTSGGFASDAREGNPLATEDFVKIRGSSSDMSQGSIEITNNPLDVALGSDGYFVVQTADGERYTRAGSFRLDSSNRLVTQNGDLVMGQGGEITLQGAAVDIAQDGAITVDGKSVARLRVVSIPADQLFREPKQLFRLADGGAITEKSDARVQSGAIEASNVNAVRELVDMIMATRLYESFNSVNQASSRMNEQRNQYLGTTS